MRLVVLLLSGCACPAFEDIEVTTTATDAAPLDPAIATAAVEDAIATFAGWTAREGVCVEAVDVADEVTLERGGETYTVAGVYRRAARRIDLDADAGIGEAALHELCHALDADERLTARHRDLLDTSVVPDSELYVTEASRLVEAFAYTCQEGPAGFGVLEAVSEACGDERVADRARFFRDVVFPGAAQVGDVEPGPPLDAPAWRTGLSRPLIAGVTVLDLGGDEAGFAVLVRIYGDGDPARLRLLHYDVDTGEPVGSDVLALPADIDAWWADARLVPSDTGRAWVAVRQDDAALLDPDVGEALDLDGISWPPVAAVVDDVFYAATPYGLTALHVATGARVDVPDEGLPGGGIDEVFPLPDGVGVRLGDTVARLVDGRWVAVPPLGGVQGPPIVHDGALLFRAEIPGGWQPVRLDDAWTTWTIEPWCDGAASPFAQLLVAAGRPFVAERVPPSIELRVSAL
ncbi:MAG: hypothetical protein ACK4YP_14535, partial [Myxococcota bacterium]